MIMHPAKSQSSHFSWSAKKILGLQMLSWSALFIAAPPEVAEYGIKFRTDAEGQHEG